MYDHRESSTDTWPSPAINTVPPETKRRCEEMYQALSCRPPMRRNWTPLIYGTAVVVLGAMVWAIVTVLA